MPIPNRIKYPRMLSESFKPFQVERTEKAMSTIKKKKNCTFKIFYDLSLKKNIKNNKVEKR